MLALFCEDLDQALHQLPEAFRIVVMLADVEGLSYKEVAETLQCPIGTVMSRLYRARQLLRKAYGYMHGTASSALRPILDMAQGDAIYAVVEVSCGWASPAAVYIRDDMREQTYPCV